MDKPYKIIKIKKYGDFHLCEPTFGVYEKAMAKMGVLGDQNFVGAGRIVFEACYIGNNIPMKEIIKNTPLFVQLSIQSFGCLKFLGDEVEKK